MHFTETEDVEVRFCGMVNAHYSEQNDINRDHLFFVSLKIRGKKEKRD